MKLTEIARIAMDEDQIENGKWKMENEGVISGGVAGVAEDSKEKKGKAEVKKETPPTPLEKHDRKYHPDGYEEGDTCKYREKLKEGDQVDMIDPENVEGEEVQQKKSKMIGMILPTKADGKDMDTVMKLYRNNIWNSPRFVANKMKLDPQQADILNEYWDALEERCLELCKMKKEDRHDLLKHPPKGEIQVDRKTFDAWKANHPIKYDKYGRSGSKGEGSSKKGGNIIYPSFALGGGSNYGVSGGSSSGSGWVNPGNNGTLGKYFHSQGQKMYTQKLDKATGLYKTKRPGGDALAREEDVPGLSWNNAKRLNFTEKATVPTALTQEQLDGFSYTANGSTYPMVGNVDGRNYIVKRGFEPNRKNHDLTDHIKHEVAADQFIRAAGLNAPVCTTFELESKRAKAHLAKLEADEEHTTLKQWKEAKKAAEQKELFKIAEYVDGGVSLVRSWHYGTPAEKKELQRQVVESYPIISFLMNTDAFKNDNVLVDKDNRIWFIDNGASFDYRAQGGKKLLDKRGDYLASHRDPNAKPWYFERTNPCDDVTGYFGLAYDNRQTLLQEILDGDKKAGVPHVTDQQLVDAAKKYDFPKLVESLPSWIKDRGTMRQYAQTLQKVIQNPPDGWIGED